VDLELRSVTDAEFPEFLRTESTAFLQAAEPDDVAFFRDWLELDRTIGVFERGRIIGNAGALSFELTVPGSATVPAAGVTVVGVLPTHRRRGILTAMMRHQLADIAARGEPLAVLTASEGAIYSRFGYGIGAFDVTVELTTAGLELAHPSRVGGTFGMLATDEAERVVPAVYDGARRARPGVVAKSAPCSSSCTGRRQGRSTASSPTACSPIPARARPCSGSASSTSSASIRRWRPRCGSS
jgi:predicted acetyltransferase